MKDRGELKDVSGTQIETASRSARPLKIGLNLPITEGALSGQTAGWADIVDIARRAERLGFDSLWVPDHLIIRWGGQTHGIWECWSLLAALAATTSRIELGALVTCTSFRNPALLAKMADTVDEISGGRLILGLGAGWDGPEYRAFGYPSDHRIDRFEEALRIIKPLLRDGRVDFEGVYYQARECELRPRGPRPGGPQILIGAKRPRMLRLAATYADVWNAEGPLRLPEDVIPLRAAGDEACVAVGRDPSTLARSASVVLSSHGDQANARQHTAESPSTEAVIETLRGYAREGLEHVQLWLASYSIAGIERLAPVFDQLDSGGSRPINA